MAMMLRLQATLPILALISANVVASMAYGDDAFRDQAVPFLQAHCVKCHNAKKASGELDLSRYTTAASIAQDFRQWEHVVAFVKGEKMPPKDAPQPSPAARSAFLATIEKTLLQEARKVADDPGASMPRRLSNADYNYTIRDLTGVDIRPAASFPIDPASGEGFNNTAEALTMSPSLFKKYYAAAQQVSDHAILTTTGFHFAPHPVVTFADQQKYYEQQIIRFYEQHSVNYEEYFTAAYLYRHRPASQREVTIEAWAADHNLSPKYLRSLWDVLQDDAASNVSHIRWLRQQWNAIPAPGDARSSSPRIRALAGEIRRMSKLLCTPETEAIVSHAGNGPVQHIDRRKKTAAGRDKFNPRGVNVLSRIGIHLDQRDTEAFNSASATFCRLFPNRFYYVDETRGLSAGYHLIEGFFRDDQPLYNSVLSDAEKRQLDRLWDELYFSTKISEKELRGFVFFERSERNFMKHRDFDSIKEEDPDLVKEENLNRFEKIYLNRAGVNATGDELANHPIHLFFEEFRQGLKRRAMQLQQAEPAYIRNLQEFAQAAYRRPLTEKETKDLLNFYQSVAKQVEFGPEQAVRACITRILTSPYFCYRLEAPSAGKSVQPLSDLAMASRLSYFLWSSTPDKELLDLAIAGKLNNEATLRAQLRRMIQDPKFNAFALEFLGQWLQFRDFLDKETVNRQVFREFDETLKLAMFEEPVRFATWLIQNDRPATELLHSDVTFVNKRLAQHYGIPFRGPDGGWTQATGMLEKGRGGFLGMAVFLTKNSQPQRTSPVKRGFWVVHKLLGEHIPAPPNDVAQLPAKETDTNGKSVRELLKLHTANANCARCHDRFDSVGLAMEGFDSIGKSRTKDLAGRPIDNVVMLPTGEKVRGVAEYSKYLAANRKMEFSKTLCRKFLGYALGRSLELSDLALLEKMQAQLEKNDYRFMTLFETVVTSPQFRNQRGRD